MKEKKSSSRPPLGSTKTKQKEKTTTTTTGCSSGERRSSLSSYKDRKAFSLSLSDGLHIESCDCSWNSFSCVRCAIIIKLSCLISFCILHSFAFLILSPHSHLMNHKFENSVTVCVQTIIICNMHMHAERERHEKRDRNQLGASGERTLHELHYKRYYSGTTIPLKGSQRAAD